MKAHANAASNTGHLVSFASEKEAKVQTCALMAASSGCVHKDHY